MFSPLCNDTSVMVFLKRCALLEDADVPQIPFNHVLGSHICATPPMTRSQKRRAKCWLAVSEVIGSLQGRKLLQANHLMACASI